MIAETCTRTVREHHLKEMLFFTVLADILKMSASTDMQSLIMRMKMFTQNHEVVVVIAATY